jgi:Resolvase, N terminal domain
MTTARPRAVIYARYSTDLQNEHLIRDQNAKCADKAAREGWEVVDEFADAAMVRCGRCWQLECPHPSGQGVRMLRHLAWVPANAGRSYRRQASRVVNELPKGSPWTKNA